VPWAAKAARASRSHGAAYSCMWRACGRRVSGLVSVWAPAVLHSPAFRCVARLGMRGSAQGGKGRWACARLLRDALDLVGAADRMRILMQR
jgi:hypothetical protein